MPSPAVCPACGKPMPVAEAAFCPFCGSTVKQTPVNADVEAELAKARAQSAPVKKHAILTAALEKYPDSLPLEEELLFLGRLHERKSAGLDFSVIKSYLLHIYRAPQELSEEKQGEMRNELFHDPRLERCLSLAPNADAFMRGYLSRLADEYVNIFLMGDNRLMRTFMGFRMEFRAGKLLAPTIAEMLGRISGDSGLTDTEREMLYDALQKAYLKVSGGDASYLSAALSRGKEA